jgi:hypothetical protein
VDGFELVVGDPDGFIGESEPIGIATQIKRGDWFQIGQRGLDLFYAGL